jgi:PKD repeat protein
MKLLPLIIISILFNSLSIAQSHRVIIQDFLEKVRIEQKLHPLDITNWNITNTQLSTNSGLRHVYIQQTHQGIPVSNGVANFSLKDKEVFSMGNRLVANLSQKTNTTSPNISPVQAIQFAAKQLQIAVPTELRVVEKLDQLHSIYNKAGISQEPIPVRLMYSAISETEVKLVWDLSIYTLDSKHYWSVQIDAQDGTLIQQNDWVLNCSFKHNTISNCVHQNRTFSTKKIYTKAPETLAQPDQYTVFALPIESPNHGSRSIVSNPANILSSPYGWHDTNAIAGAEYTITKGNNVYAYEDIDSDNLPGFSPDGTSLLEFNFPYSSTGNPNLYQSAAISNLFYMNNMMHDIWYHYGFDEASGNFQNNNYGRGGSTGIAGDEVLAEAQDNANTNNASFTVPPDGIQPRMQLFLWNSSGNNLGNYLTLNTPSTIAGNYTAADATFGPGLPLSPLTADLVLIEDNTPPINDACGLILNQTALSGKIALIDLGICNFVFKVEAAQNAGAIAVILINNTPNAPFQMSGTSANINIPSIMISQSHGLIIKNQLSTGNVNATISNSGSSNNPIDSDLDNGIIAHEYGHGISMRLTGSAGNSNCLTNPEQMGEGWSDWFALMLTIKPGDLGTDPRGFGTYVSNQATTGQGLRPAPYSTDFAINPFTYRHSNDTGQISQPHGIGFIFATVLWDLNWALIDFHGGTPDVDLYNGTGGNNIAMHLIIEALKMQPCLPGMIDGRNAILSADQALYGGMHECLIWNVFATRGFGDSASQGSSNNRRDQIEAFDLPSNCQPNIAPIALFSKNNPSCRPNVSFFDNSTNVPLSWFWDFGDGNTSTLQNPIYSYSSSGSYTVKLVASNSGGSDSLTQQVTITNLPSTPIANNLELCLGDTAYVAASGTGLIYWKDSSNRVIQVGDTLCIPNVGTEQTYYAENGVNFSPAFVGPPNGMIGLGGYHSSSYFGALNITAKRSFEILSAWVNADGAGPRTFSLVSGINNSGTIPNPSNIIAEVTVNLVDGPQRVDLNLIIPEAGNYNIGSNNVDLHRNTSGANYPYNLLNYMSIDSSSSFNTATKSYYYFYDLEIRGPQCISTLDTVVITPIVSAFSSIDNGGGTFSFSSSSTSASNWLWNFGDNTPTSTLPNPMHTYSNAGNYTVSLTINNGACTSTQTVSVPVGLQTTPNNKLQIKLLPNPTSGLTQLILSNIFPENLEIQLTDINGKQIQKMQIPSGQTSLNLDLSKLPTAVYLVHIKGNNFSEVRKVIVK